MYRKYSYVLGVWFLGMDEVEMGENRVWRRGMGREVDREERLILVFFVSGKV